ncbi:hypothetical protein B0I35DRAFT_411656 [Stachybotrys elegans]|uniref:Uncharacterized protein n=1 Tax=Stachybotrys elegans TaxID=80388 RepID=A0A8K0SQQ9_9HYPO|nr:hypothetical protein B0I35DRAFT_411656 [Stachybotrys elegans]
MEGGQLLRAALRCFVLFWCRAKRSDSVVPAWLSDGVAAFLADSEPQLTGARGLAVGGWGPSTIGLVSIPFLSWSCSGRRGGLCGNSIHVPAVRVYKKRGTDRRDCHRSNRNAPKGGLDVVICVFFLGLCDRCDSIDSRTHRTPIYRCLATGASVPSPANGG